MRIVVDSLHRWCVPSELNGHRPFALRHRSLSVVSGLVVLLKVSLVFLGFFASSLSSATDISEESILTLLNEERSASSLQQLKIDSRLSAAAKAKAEDMLSLEYFSHYSPNGRSPWDFIHAQNYRYTVAGENLAIDFLTAEGAHRGWMASPSHRDNILSDEYEDVGIGIVRGLYKGESTAIAVQMFGLSSERTSFVDSVDFSKTNLPKNQDISSSTGEEEGGDGLTVAKVEILPSLEVEEPVNDTFVGGGGLFIKGKMPTGDPVEFYIDDELIEPELDIQDTGDFEARLDISSYEEGEHTLRAVQGDVSYVRRLIFDLVPPALVFSSSCSRFDSVDVSFSATYVVSAEAEDAEGNALSVEKVGLEYVIEQLPKSTSFIILRLEDEAGNINEQRVERDVIDQECSSSQTVLGLSTDSFSDFTTSALIGVLIVLFLLWIINVFVKIRVQHAPVLAHSSLVILFVVLLLLL